MLALPHRLSGDDVVCLQRRKGDFTGRILVRDRATSDCAAVLRLFHVLQVSKAKLSSRAKAEKVPVVPGSRSSK